MAGGSGWIPSEVTGTGETVRGWTAGEQNQNQVYCQVGFHTQRICLGVLVHAVTTNIVRREDKERSKQVLHVKKLKYKN